jgi:hypothetical protein
MPPVNPEAKQRPIEIYWESSQKLRQLINEDLSNWNS